MSERSGLDTPAVAGPPSCEPHSAFPQTASALLDRLGPPHGLVSEVQPIRRILEPLPTVPIETSVSLGPNARRELRLTLAIPPRLEDPQGRGALVAALSALGAERVSTTADDALAMVAPAPRERQPVRSVALRVRAREPVRPRPGARVGGRSAAERSARAGDAMRSLGLDRTAAVHERLSAELAGNPFNAAVLYGLGFDLGPDRALGAKTYFACEWPDVAFEVLRCRLAEDFGLEGVEAVELLAASACAGWRRTRWLLEVSFELPADPASGIRAKAYISARHLASNEAEAYKVMLRIASELGLDHEPYEQLVKAVRPDGLIPERPCSLRAGVSASQSGASLEVYLFDPARFTAT